MYQSTTELRAHFATGRTSWIADLYTIRLASGTLLRWSGSDVAVTFGGTTWALGPAIDRGAVSRAIGLEPGTMQMTIRPRASDLVGADPLALALRRGDFDGAAVQLDRAYAATPGAAIIGVRAGWFLGRVGEISANGAEFDLEVADPLADLDAAFPRNVVQAGCLNRLFDDVCGVPTAPYRVSGTVTGAVNASRTSFATTLGTAAGYYTLGTFRWTSGANAGRSAMVRQADSGGVLKFAVSWPSVVSIGDAFEVLPGCDKRLETCRDKFSNGTRFRGFPVVPAAETTT